MKNSVLHIVFVYFITLSLPLFCQESVHHYFSGKQDIKNPIFILDSFFPGKFSIRRASDTLVGTDAAIPFPRVFRESSFTVSAEGDTIEEMPALGIIGDPFYSKLSAGQLRSFVKACFSEEEENSFFVGCVKILVQLLVDATGQVIEVKQIIQWQDDTSTAISLAPLEKLDSLYRSVLQFEDNGFCEREGLSWGGTGLMIDFSNRDITVILPNSLRDEMN